MIEHPSPSGAHPARANNDARGCIIILIALLLLGLFAFVPVTAMGSVAVALEDAAPLLKGLVVTAIQGVLLLPIYALVVLLTRRRAGWRPLAALATVLLLLAGYLLLSGLLRTLFQDRPNGYALALLLLGLPYTLLAGWLAPRLAGLGPRRFTEMLGLGRADLPVLLLALALAALLTLPWPITGALGDTFVSLGLILQALAENLPLVLLLWGCAFVLLNATFAATWLSGLTVIFLFSLMLAANVAPTGDWGALFNAGVLLPLGLLLTELRARGRSVWPVLLLLIAYRLTPRLFVDPRVFELQGLPELQHLYSHLAIWFALVPLGPLLWLLRQILRDKTFSRGLRLGLSGSAAAFLALAWLLGYFVLGAPGFTNDSYLIIMEEQADLSAAYSIPDREARLQYVYDTLVESAERTQSPVRAELDRRGRTYRPYYLINMIRVDGPLLSVRRFERLPGVAEVIRNPNVRIYRYPVPFPGYTTLPTPPAGLQENLAAINVAGAWALDVTGAGIVVAGQDTGYEWDHPALIRQYRGWDGATVSHAYNWHDAWSDFDIPTDADGHGTHTMGTVLGDDGNRNRTGVAPDAQWIGCRNMRRGLGNPGAYAECMEFFLAPYPPGGDPFRDGDVYYAPHLTTNSWGCPEIEGCQPDTLEAGVAALRAAGIMSVVAAGNDGPACETASTPPSNYATSFVVGAVYSYGDNRITSFSSRGPIGDLLKPDIVAPGYEVRSSIPGDGYGTASGTSMATPHVAGLVALLWSADPALIGDIDATEALIRQTATPKPLNTICTSEQATQTDPLGLSENTPICGCGDVTGTPNNVYGYGLINAEAAVKAALGE